VHLQSVMISSCWRVVRSILVCQFNRSSALQTEAFIVCQTSGNSPEPASEQRDAGAHLAKRQKRPSLLSNARASDRALMLKFTASPLPRNVTRPQTVNSSSDNIGRDAQFLTIWIEKLQHTPPISAAAMTKRSTHEQPSWFLETELNAIKSSRGRREPTSHSSPPSLPLRYHGDRVTGNGETTNAPIPSARQEIIHHFSRRPSRSRRPLPCEVRCAA